MLTNMTANNISNYVLGLLANRMSIVWKNRLLLSESKLVDKTKDMAIGESPRYAPLLIRSCMQSLIIVGYAIRGSSYVGLI